MKSALFRSLSFGQTSLPNRIAMSPMTRSRTSRPGDVPNAMMAEYYAQRASAGLIITEATQISAQGQGYSFTPGIYTPSQIDGWKLVTEGKGVSRFDDGREETITNKAGDCTYFPNLNRNNSFVHDLTNVGETDLVFVTVEFNSLSIEPSGGPVKEKQA